MRNRCGLLAGSWLFVALGACGGSGSDGDSSTDRLLPTMTINLGHSDLVFDPTRQLLYAVASTDSALPARIVAVAVASGQVRDLVAPSDPPPFSFAEPVQGTLSLSAQARYLYFTTTGGAVSRVDLAMSTLDLRVPAPAASNAKVATVAASRTDDLTAYAQLESNGSEPDAIGVLRSAQWGTQWVQIPQQLNVARALTVRDDDAEVISRSYDLYRLRIGAGGPEVVLATGTTPSSRSPAVPQYVSSGVLAQGAQSLVYDATTLSFLFDVPGASVCGVLPSRSRLVCAGPTVFTGHELFVFDLPTRSRVASWWAGFDTGNVFAVTPAQRVTPVGAGRVAISYGSTTKLGTFGPSSLAIYSNAAFN
jgi:hypothetical protein